jgi:ketosteroid isomerase-like protein
MDKRTMSRRTIFEAVACALAAASIPQIVSAEAETSETGLGPNNEATIRRYYAAWGKKDWHTVDLLLADDFTFSSPLDDHITKDAFKKGCWDTQIDFTDRFDLKRVFGSGNEAFVLYVGRTTNGKTFRNVEYFRLKDRKVEAIECYFSAQASFPSAVSTEQR